MQNTNKINCKYYHDRKISSLYMCTNFDFEEVIFGGKHNNYIHVLKRCFTYYAEEYSIQGSQPDNHIWIFKLTKLY